MENKLDVKMGNLVIAQAPTIIQSLGIGSCVVVCLYDKTKKLGGVAHIVSPDSTRVTSEINPLRFADKAITEMVQSLKQLGSLKIRLEAKIFGGSSMFPKVMKLIAIGKENVEAVRKSLNAHKIKISVEDVGGNKGRSIWLDLNDGSVIVTKKGEETRRY